MGAWQNRKAIYWLGGGLLLVALGVVVVRAGVSPQAVWERLAERNAGGGEKKDEGEDKATATTTPGEAGVVRFDAESLRLAHLGLGTAGYFTIPTGLAVTGTVEPNQSGVFKVTSRVAGQVQSLRAYVGANVRAGETLATLVSVDLAQAQAAYREATAKVAVARTDLQRQRKLAGLGVFGNPPLEAAQTRAAQAQNEVAGAQAAVIHAQNQVSTAQSAVVDAENQVRVRQAGVSQAQTQFKLTQSTLRRDQALFTAEFISKQHLEQSQATNERAGAEVEVARAKLAQGQANVQAAQSSLAAAQANRQATTAALAAAQARSAVAAQARAREESVYRGGYLTSQEIVAAQAAEEQAQLDQQAAADAVRVIGGTPGGGDVLTVTAPLGGRVTERIVSRGETVAAGAPLFTIINLHTVWVELDVFTQDLPAVGEGQRVTVTSDADPGRVFSGVVSYLGDLVDPTTHTVKVRCVIPNENSRLKPGAFVQGEILSPTPRPALMVPQAAVQKLHGAPVVFVPTAKPGEFRAQPVAVGQTAGGRTEISSGLHAGDRLVTTNAFLVLAQATKSEFGGD